MAMKIGEYFVQLGKITREQLAKALDMQKTQKTYLGEILVSEKMLSENDLLTYLAGIFNLQYITSEKLEKMTIQSNVAQVVPERIAETKGIFPLKYSFNEGKLTLLTHAPQDAKMLDELKIILDNIKVITPVIAYSKAIKAIIFKQYKGDLIAFDRFFPKNVDMKGFIPVGEAVLDKDILKQDAPRKVLKDPKEFTRNTSFTQIINQGEILQSDGGDTTITNRVNKLKNGVTIVGHEEFLEAIKVFTSIIDSIREGGFKHHTQRVVGLCMKLGKAYKMNEVDMNDLIIAAYLHDAGKKKHLSAFDIKDKECADTVIKYSSAGARLFAGCNLSKQTKSILSNMYETVNGAGFPQGLKGNDIPIGAQILLLADSYDYLTQVSSIPAPTAYFRMKALGFFTDKLLDTLKEELQINTLAAAATGNAVKIAGIVVTENRDLLDEIAQRFSAQNIQIFTAPQIEIAALILKKQGDTINFILSDIDVKNSQFTPFKLINAIRTKGIFPKLQFFLFSTGTISPQNRDQATQMKAAGIFPNFNSSKNMPELLSMLRS
ncbi:MAG TPA: HD domain-containing phosphohydrolase [bacterium]|nr:HD domain-containing phosphohydrolase [bacterium]